MAFKTTRPKTAQEMIQKIKQHQSEIKSSQKSIMENARLSKQSSEAKELMEATILQHDLNDQSSQKVEKIKQRRRQHLVMEAVTVGKISLLEDAKKALMNKVLFEMVYDAFWLDDNVKESMITEAYEEYKNTVAVMESTCSKSKTSDANKSKFMKAVEETVDEICTKSSKRILDKAKETGDIDINFDLTAEEESELDQKLSELGRDEIIDMVRDKVLSVVQDERDAGKKKAEILKDIDDSANETDDEMVGEATSHQQENNLQNIADIRECVSEQIEYKDDVKKLLLESGAASVAAEAVLSSALIESDAAIAIDLFKEYKSILSKSHINCVMADPEKYPYQVKSCARYAITQHKQMCDDRIKHLQSTLRSIPEKKSPEKLLEQMRMSSVKRSIKNSNGRTLFDSMMMKNTVTIRNDAVEESISVTEGKDIQAALIESIFQYTVLETLNTLQIYKFTSSDVSNLRTKYKSSITQ